MAVDTLNLSLARGETLGIVGESGSGKSVSMLSVLRLIDNPNCVIEGQARFEGRDLLAMGHEELRAIRGAQIAMIFQDPMTSLNPVLSVNRQLTEGLQLHLGMDAGQAKRRAIELLEMVGIPSAKTRE